MTDECIHGLGPVSACTICNGRDKREADESVLRSRAFAAKYPGHCNGCNLPIQVGQMIELFITPRHANMVMHEGCSL